MRKRINEILAQLQQFSGAHKAYDKLVSDHEHLTRQFDDDTTSLRQAEDAVKDANLRLSDLSLRETVLKNEYAIFFDKRFDRRPRLSQELSALTRANLVEVASVPIGFAGGSWGWIGPRAG